MADPQLEMRPAWRNQIFMFIILAFLILSAVSVTFAEGNGSDAATGSSSAVVWLIAAFTALVIVWRRYSWKFSIDSVRVSSHHGIIARNQKTVRIQDLRSVSLQQGLIQRLLNVGNVAFYTAGSASAEVLYRGIKNPAIVRDDVQRMLDERTGDR